MNSTATDPYTSLLAKYGPTAQGCGWSSAKTQHLRFDALLDIYKLRPLGRSLLDVGCGTGDLSPLAFKRELFYTGIDRCKEMVIAAQRKHPGSNFLHESLMECPAHYDVVVASGLFTYSDYREFMESIDRLVGIATQAVVFNCLSDWGERPPEEFTVSPDRTLNWCRKIVPQVALRHDYHPGDFTIYLFKS